MKKTFFSIMCALAMSLMMSDRVSADVLPESSKRVIHDNELSVLNENDLWLARNEIFARHGYVFRDGELLRYFSQFDWYKPRTIAPELSSVELSNVESIQRYEDKFVKPEIQSTGNTTFQKAIETLAEVYAGHKLLTECYKTTGKNKREVSSYVEVAERFTTALFTHEGIVSEEDVKKTKDNAYTEGLKIYATGLKYAVFKNAGVGAQNLSYGKKSQIATVCTEMHDNLILGMKKGIGMFKGANRASVQDSTQRPF